MLLNRDYCWIESATDCLAAAASVAFNAPVTPLAPGIPEAPIALSRCLWVMGALGGALSLLLEQPNSTTATTMVAACIVVPGVRVCLLTRIAQPPGFSYKVCVHQ